MSEVKLSQRDDIIRHLMTEGSITGEVDVDCGKATTEDVEE